MTFTVNNREFSLSPEELEDFRKNGYAGPFTLYKPEEIKEIWKKERLNILDRDNAIYDDGKTLDAITNISNYDRHLDNEFLAKHICRPEIVDRMVSMMGEDLLCWRTEFFPKYPGDDGTDWHQVDTFEFSSGEPQLKWPENDDFGGTITVWTALTDTTKDTACLQFIPGTHHEMFYDETKSPEYNPEETTNLEKDGVSRSFFGYDYRDFQIDPNWKPDESKAVSMEMKAGQFIMFWSTLMHASHPHKGKTDEMRLGFAARYVPTKVKVYDGIENVKELGGEILLEKYGCVLVAGEDKYRHNVIKTETTKGVPFKIQSKITMEI